MPSRGDAVTAGATTGSFRPRLARWWMMLSGMVLAALLLGWWALGLRSWTPTISGFSSRVEWVMMNDVTAVEVFGKLRPGVPLVFPTPEHCAQAFSLALGNMEERTVALFVGSTMRCDITVTDGRIVFSEPSLLERSHHEVARWLRQKWGLKLWPNR